MTIDEAAKALGLSLVAMRRRVSRAPKRTDSVGNVTADLGGGVSGWKASFCRVWNISVPKKLIAAKKGKRT